MRLSALGDVVMALALVRYLQKALPSTRLTWVCGRAVYPLLGDLEKEGVTLVPIDKPKGPGDWLALRKRLPAEPFDVLLAAQASWRANFLYPFIRAKRKIGFSADRAKDAHRLFVGEAIAPARPHLVDGFLQFAEALGLPFPEAVEFRLPVSANALSAVRRHLPKMPFLAVNVCSSKSERDWPVQHYIDALSVIQERHGVPLVFLGGPSVRERERVGQVVAGLKGPVVDLTGRTSLPEVVAVLSECRGLLSPDTGAVHIARAFEKPVCGLYAVAPTHRTGPYRAYEFCVDRFDEAVKTLAKKDPETLPWSARVHFSGAMDLIGVDAVIEKLETLLALGNSSNAGASKS